MSDPLSILRVYLTPGSETALHQAAERTGDTQTDTLNRALQIYDHLTSAVDKGARVFMQWPDKSEEPLDRESILFTLPTPTTVVCTCDCPECAGGHGCCGRDSEATP